MIFYRMRIATLLLLTVVASGFAPQIHAQSGEAFASAAMLEMNADPAFVGDVLRAEALDWADTPHVLGGDSRRGIDCSSLMQQWYSSLFGVQLPRTSGEQFAAGERVDREALSPGDLVFFGTARRITHVGAYVGGGEFAHVSSSVGVTVSRMDEAYWKRRYRGARRVLPIEDGIVLSLPVAAAEAPTPSDQPSAIVRTDRPAEAAPTFTRASVRGGQSAPAPRRVGW